MTSEACDNTDMIIFGIKSYKVKETWNKISNDHSMLHLLFRDDLIKNQFHKDKDHDKSMVSWSNLKAVWRENPV